VMALRRARGGGLWVGTASEGLLRLDDEGRLQRRWGREQGLCSNSIPALHEDEDGTLWAGCNGEGLSRLRADGLPRNISPNDGLWDGVTLSLQPDHRGQFWVSTNRGFYRVARAELQAFADGRQARVHSVGYGPGDALRSTTFAGSVQPAGAVDGKGRVWLPSLRGVVIVDPERLPDSGRPPAVRVEEFAIDGQWQARPPGPLQLPAGSPPLTFRYAADTVLNAERVRFRFQMLGLSERWIDAGKGREARFPALPPGSYSFRVAASLDGREWREMEQALAVQVPPLLHQHPLARALMVLLLLAVGYGAYRLRTRALRHREAELQRLVEERTEALRQANEELQRLSFTDALTGLANRRHFDEQLATEWRRCARQQLPLALLVIDVDHFKAYNDAVGHLPGDTALQAIAQLIQAHSGRAGELAARYGGEEFVLLLPGLDRPAALAQGQRLVRACEAAALPHPASPTAAVITLSVGVAAAQPAEGGSAATLFTLGDAALYRAKESGRNHAV
jgi:diguanylate cyclase (GGDEF)-like protein